MTIKKSIDNLEYKQLRLIHKRNKIIDSIFFRFNPFAKGRLKKIDKELDKVEIRLDGCRKLLLLNERLDKLLDD